MLYHTFIPDLPVTASGAAEDKNKENEPPKKNTRRRGKRPTQSKDSISIVQYRQDMARQQELRLLGGLARRVIAPLVLHPKYKTVEGFLRQIKDFPREALRKDGGKAETVLDLRAVYRKISRREYQSIDECILDVENLWEWMGEIANGEMRVKQSVRCPFFYNTWLFLFRYVQCDARSVERV